MKLDFATLLAGLFLGDLLDSALSLLLKKFYICIESNACPQKTTRIMGVPARAIMVFSGPS